MPVYYGFTRWSYGGETVHAGEATVMPRKKSALFRTPVRSGESRLIKTIKNHRGHFPVIASSTRFIPIQCVASQRRYGVVPVGPDVHTGARNRNSVN